MKGEAVTSRIIGNYDPERICPHTPDQTYTREPCSCGRELWPPRGRGRGESLNSPRRIAARLKALAAKQLRMQGLTYREIARKLGYHTISAAWHAVQRLHDQYAERVNFEDEQQAEHRHRRRRARRPITQAELDRAREYV